MWFAEHIERRPSERALRRRANPGGASASGSASERWPPAPVTGRGRECRESLCASGPPQSVGSSRSNRRAGGSRMSLDVGGGVASVEAVFGTPSRRASHPRSVALAIGARSDDWAGLLAGLCERERTKHGPEFRRGYPPNLSILLSGGKETNGDSPSNGEWIGKCPASNLRVLEARRVVT